MGSFDRETVILNCAWVKRGKNNNRARNRFMEANIGIFRFRQNQIYNVKVIYYN